MKKFTWVLLLQVAAIVLLNAQEAFRCGTLSGTNKWMEHYLRNREAFEKSNQILYVPVTMQIIGTDAGEGYTPLKQVLSAFCRLNRDFAPSNIQFYMKGNIKYINRTAYYDHDQSSVGESIGREFNVPNTINCYWVSNSGGPGVGGYTVGFGGNIVVLSKGTNEFNNFLSHEMGHALALYHTFHGWESFEYNLTQNAPERVYGVFVRPQGRLAERVDLRNCAIAGDGFCDTAPDYLEIGEWECTAEKQSSIIQKDPTGQAFRSDGSLIMSYSKCSTRFSDEQIQAMRAHLLSEKRNYIVQEQPFSLIDTVSPVLLAPQKGALVDFKKVTLQWNEVPGATNYIIELSRISNFAGTLTETFTASTNSITLNDLINNRNYFWRVQAYNGISFCTGNSASSSFRTTTAAGPSTAVEDLVTKARFDIFPNPLSNQQLLTIESTLPENTRLSIRLLDLSGKLLQTMSYEALSGTNRFQLPTPTLPAGVYLLYLVGDRINAVERIVIQ